jgi:hypothetical protein
MTMASSRAVKRARRKRRRRSNWLALARALRRQSRETWRTLRRAPRWLQIATTAAALLLIWSAVNLTYQIARKPTELFYPVSGALAKAPAETWHQYGLLFRQYSTATIAPELLAALAQSESAGDPVAHTYWHWRFSWNPLRMYEPASSAVGMYQMTDAAFAEARHYCIRRHSVVEEGAWYDPRACWFNGTYTRIVPSDAIELTAIYLDRNVASLLAGSRPDATKQQKQDLAAIIHLCGAGPAEAFLRRGFHLAPGERCGDHEAAAYLARVDGAMPEFRRLAAAE